MGFRCGTGQPNCDIYKQGQGCGRFHADPDIAGIGVREMTIPPQFYSELS